MELTGAARMLDEIGIMLELKGENPFKSRAYYSGARIIAELGEKKLNQLVREDRLKEVKGIGMALNDKLSEFVLTGKLDYYEELKASIPEGLFDMLKVPGLGPRKVSTLYEALEINSLAELEYACRENRLVNLKGFGPKTQQNILEGIEFLRRHQGRYFYGEAKTVADKLILELQSFSETVDISLAGSIRRCRELVKDIDLVASADEPSRLTHIFAGLPQVEKIIALGDTKVSVETVNGINADLRVVEPWQFPYALHHFTGSKEHNTTLRSRAKSMGLKMNEYGLFKGEDLIPCDSEKELFSKFGLSYIPPELREDNGEIEAAEKGELPSLVVTEDIKGVFHIHTTFSDGSNSLEEIVKGSIDKGYDYIGISDHSQSAFYAGGLKSEDLNRQREEIERLRETYGEIKIFCGVESDIRVDGSLDYPDEVLEKLDFVIASVHSGLKMEKQKMTDRLIRAVRHPMVTILGHPTNRLLLGRDSSAIELETLFKTAIEEGVILELNANPARLDLDWRYLKKLKEMGGKVSINPDAHSVEGFSDVEYGVAIGRKGWLEKKDVFNTLSAGEVEAHLKKRRSVI